MHDIPHGGSQGAVIAIGKFEGVHLGHQTILARLVEEAAKRGARATVVTFRNNPLTVLSPGRAPKPLMSPEQRAAALIALGVDEVVMIDFDETFAALSPEEFVRRELVEAQDVVHVIVGDDFRFGAKAAGTPAVLAALGETHGFTVEVVDEVADPEFGRISSTRVREALGAGNVEQAAQMLGAPHLVSGIVVHGDARGRELGFPTANLGARPGASHVDGFVPADGVYGGIVTVGGEEYVAAISVGNNPTFTPEADSRVEAFLLDYSGDLYGAAMSVEFVMHVRPMLSFTSIDALLEEMRRDVATVRERVLLEDSRETP